MSQSKILPSTEDKYKGTVNSEGRRTLITLLEKAAAGIAGETGTVIHN